MNTNPIFTLLLCLIGFATFAQQENNVQWNLSPQIQTAPLYQNCARTLYSYHSLSKKELKKASYAIENGEILSYDFDKHTLTLIATSTGTTTVFLKVGEKIVAKNTFEVAPIPSPQLALLGKDKTELNLDQPLSSDLEVEISLVIDPTFAILQPEEAKQFEITQYEMTLFRDGRTTKQLTKNTVFFAIQEFSPKAGDGVAIKVVGLKQPFEEEDKKIALSKPRIAFFIK